MQWLTEAGPNFPKEATWQYTWNTIQTGFNNLVSSKHVLSSVYSSLQNCSQFHAFYRDTDPLVSALYFTSALIVVHYVMSEITKNYSQVDKAWSILPGLYAWHFTIHDYVLHQSFHPRLLAATILITIWGTRLTYNFARKGGYYWSGQDYRYPYLREKLGPVLMGLLNIVFIAPFQDYLLLLMVTPLYMTNLLTSVTATRALNTLDYLAIVSHLTLLFIETVADEQQYVFQTEKYALLNHLKPEQLTGDYKLGFLWHSGLFQYSRHANFFAEMSIWWVIYLFSISAVQEAATKGGSLACTDLINWTIAGPIVLTGLFQGSTWLTEKISSEKYPVYLKYRQSVSRFIPWFPSSPNKQSLSKKEL